MESRESKRLSVEVGDWVEFDTTWKYNPGFSSTYSYNGEVIKQTRYGDNPRYNIKVDGIGIANVPLKHIIKVCKTER